MNHRIDEKGDDKMSLNKIYSKNEKIRFYTKKVYNTIVWFLIVPLIAGGLFFIGIYQMSIGLIMLSHPIGVIIGMGSVILVSWVLGFMIFYVGFKD